MAINKYEPNMAIHPGSTLKEILDSLRMTQKELALRSGLTPKTINEIIQGKNPITPDTATKLSVVFGMSVSFWNNLQKNYETTIAKLQAEKKIDKEIPLLRNFSCYSELVKWKYVKPARDKKEKVLNLLKFFGVSSLSLIKKTEIVAFRKSNKGEVLSESLAAWLRAGEIEASRIETKTFNKDGLMRIIEYLRSLTRESPKTFCEKIVKECSVYGVAVVFVPYFKKTYVNGATRWLNANKAIIQLSLRGSYDDIFWFTFFHELGHILKHGKKDKFIEFEERFKTGYLAEKEREADVFASNTLIPKKDYEAFIKESNFSDSAIKDFARKINISPSIIAGRLSHDYNDWRRWAHLRKRLKFVEE